MKSKILLSLGAIILLSGCSVHPKVKISSQSSDKGSIVIKPSRKINQAVVMLDNELVYDRSRNIKTITLENVDEGTHSVTVTSGSWYYTETLNQRDSINVKSGKTSTDIVSVPPFSTGYWIFSSAVYLATFFLIFAL